MVAFQRQGSLSNAHVGRDFERVAQCELERHGIPTEPNFPVSVGVHSTQKIHRFDLGSNNPSVIVECKSHRWTDGGNVPSAKLTVWNEAMLYFLIAPSTYRKIFFVLRDVRRDESLAGYYLRQYGHLVPRDVEFWEFDESVGLAKRL